jgi:Predicted transcriptional regulator
MEKEEYSFPREGFVRIEQIQAIYPVSKTTLYKEIGLGKFPKPIKRGRSAFWDAIAVRECLRDAGATISVEYPSLAHRDNSPTPASFHA